MTSKTRFSLSEPTIQDLKVALQRDESRKNQDLENALPIKLLLLGTEGVGKTSIISRFMFDSFPDITNCGIQEHSKKLIKYRKQPINLNLIDPGSLVKPARQVESKLLILLG